MKRAREQPPALDRSDGSGSAPDMDATGTLSTDTRTGAGAPDAKRARSDGGDRPDSKPVHPFFLPRAAASSSAPQSSIAPNSSLSNGAWTLHGSVLIGCFNGAYASLPMSSSTSTSVSASASLSTSTPTLSSTKSCAWVSTGVPVRYALFDLDHTLIAPRGQRRFPRHDDPHDWQWFAREVSAVVQSLQSAGYRIAILSNQKNLLKNETKARTFKRKVAHIAAALPDVAFFVAAATGDDEFRKPGPGLASLVPDLDRARSFYVGDAAGRPAFRTRDRDHADSDLEFARRARLGTFLTPEELLLLTAARFRPARFLAQAPAVAAVRELVRSAASPPPLHAPELVLVLGPPRSGKSRLIETYLASHERVAPRDWMAAVGACEAGMLGREGGARPARWVMECAPALFATRAGRAKVLACAAAAEVRVRCVFVGASREEAVYHAVATRFAAAAAVTAAAAAHALAGGSRTGRMRERGASASSCVFDHVFETFFARLEHPSVDEGFASVTVVPFVPDPDAVDLNAWRLWDLAMPCNDTVSSNDGT